MKRTVSIVNVAVRVALGLVALAALGFCVFGFAATFEPMAAARQWIWRAVYGGLGLGCVGALMKLALPGREQDGRGSTEQN